MNIVLIVACVFSMSLNIVFIWYVRRLIQQLLLFTDNISALEEYFDSFDGHLGEVYELEMFYGDETLGGLIRHSRDLLEKIQEFRDSFSLEEAPEEELIDDKD